MAAIRRMYPNAPNPTRVRLSNWSKDEFALGSYPFVKAGGSPQDCVDYEEYQTTNQRVFFAGDGVSCQLIGTVHGAYITGLKAAQNAMSPSNG